jgi:hypothetical protein
MTKLRNSIISAAIGASVLASSALSASAAIVCSGNVCWHTHENHRYPPEARVIIHPDNWSWGPSEHYDWREHEGRGYWKGDTWTEFQEQRDRD